MDLDALRGCFFLTFKSQHDFALSSIGTLLIEGVGGIGIQSSLFFRADIEYKMKKC